VEVRLKVYTIDPMDAGAELITVTGSDIKPHPEYFSNGAVTLKSFLNQNMVHFRKKKNFHNFFFFVSPTLSMTLPSSN
jgi:hypothetical protein